MNYICTFSENVPHDFECKVEIYCHKLHEDLTIASTPKKLKKKINDLSGSVGRSVGKRLSGLVSLMETRTSFRTSNIKWKKFLGKTFRTC